MSLLEEEEQKKAFSKIFIIVLLYFRILLWHLLVLVVFYAIPTFILTLLAKDEFDRVSEDLSILETADEECNFTLVKSSMNFALPSSVFIPFALFFLGICFSLRLSTEYIFPLTTGTLFLVFIVEFILLWVFYL